MELMEQLLATMEVGVGKFTSCDVRRGYDLTFDASSAATVHYCMDGNGELMVISPEQIVKLREHVTLESSNRGCRRCRVKGFTPLRLVRCSSLLDA